MNNNYMTQLVEASTCYPAIIMHYNPQMAAYLNKIIYDVAVSMLPSGRYQKMNIISAASKYDITVQQHEILSIRLENYFYPENMANGITIVKGLTLNLITGKRYRLKDLFEKNSNYQEYLNKIINKQIEDKEIPLINQFPGINGQEEFYLTEDSLVIVYQQYQLSPGYYGVLEFEIPYSDLRKIITKDGPIGLLIN